MLRRVLEYPMDQSRVDGIHAVVSSETTVETELLSERS